jgi:hypothetical protein
MQPNTPQRNRPDRLSSWRQVAGISEPGTGESVREHLAEAHRTLRSLLIDTIVELDITYYEVNAYLDSGNRSLLHAQWLDERAGYVLTRHEYAVIHLLEQAMGAVASPQPPVVKTVYLAPPPPKSWWQRLFGR